MSSAQRRQRVELALQAVGLIDRANHYPRQLSGGRTASGYCSSDCRSSQSGCCGRADRELDAETSDQVQDLLQRLNRELNITMLIVTHDRDVASIASKQLVLDRGKFLDRSFEVSQ